MAKRRRQRRGGRRACGTRRPRAGARTRGGRGGVGPGRVCWGGGVVCACVRGVAGWWVWSFGLGLGFGLYTPQRHPPTLTPTCNSDSAAAHAGGTMSLRPPTYCPNLTKTERRLTKRRQTQGPAQASQDSYSCFVIVLFWGSGGGLSCLRIHGCIVHRMPALP